MSKKKHLGADPLAWVGDSRIKVQRRNKPGKQSKPNLQGLQSKNKMIVTSKDRPANERGLAEGWTRTAFIVRKEHLNKVKALAYWTPGLTIKEVLDRALNEYLKEKKVKPIPEKQ